MLPSLLFLCFFFFCCYSFMLIAEMSDDCSHNVTVCEGEYWVCTDCKKRKRHDVDGSDWMYKVEEAEPIIVPCRWPKVQREYMTWLSDAPIPPPSPDPPPPPPTEEESKEEKKQAREIELGDTIDWVETDKNFLEMCRNDRDASTIDPVLLARFPTWGYYTMMRPDYSQKGKYVERPCRVFGFNKGNDGTVMLSCHVLHGLSGMSRQWVNPTFVTRVEKWSYENAEQISAHEEGWIWVRLWGHFEAERDGVNYKLNLQCKRSNPTNDDE
jgi:hypothetical protein